jgi:uncharacterized protein
LLTLTFPGIPFPIISDEHSIVFDRLWGINYLLMKKLLIGILILVNLLSAIPVKAQNSQIKVLVITGGHDYTKESFNAMLSDMSKYISFEIQEFPKAYEMFSSENIDKYDVLVFYHMWQSISEEQKKILSDCIFNGKPLFVLHHSICAFDNWEEYTHIIRGRYFHQPSVLNEKEYPASSYKHDIRFIVNVLDSNHPVTKDLKDFEVFDETYKVTTLQLTKTSIIENYYCKPLNGSLRQNNCKTRVV